MKLMSIITMWSKFLLYTTESLVVVVFPARVQYY